MSTLRTLTNFLIRSLLLAVATALPVSANQQTRTLDVYWIDSEGGGSTLIVTPADESVLIDTGNPGGRDPSRIIATARSAGLKRIDHVVLTHFHVDHFGGAAEVAAEIPFGTIHERAIPEGDPDGRNPSTFPLAIKPYRAISAQREHLVPGHLIPLQTAPDTATLELRCLAADQKRIEPPSNQRLARNPLTGTVPPKDRDSSDNANSAVFLLSFGAFRFFDGGDLTWNLEEQLVTPFNLVGTVDVYQTNHHGLQVSNNPVLVQSLAPTVVVMNNGPYKGGEAGTFAAIHSAKSVQTLYQLHRSYNVAAELNAPAEFVANHENLRGAAAAKCPANIVRMSVAADGSSYTISIPATGKSTTYRTR